MRFHRSYGITSAWVVLAIAACSSAVRSPSDRPWDAGVAGPSLPGAPAGVTAFINVGVVPMDHETVLAEQTVLVEGGRITAVGPANRVRVPAGAMRIDGHGKFLLPGLADMHAHPLMGGHIGITAEASWADSAEAAKRLFMWVANGATTIREMDYVGDESGSSDRNGRLALQFRARAAAGQEWIPRIYTAGQVAPVQYIANGANAKPVLDSISTYVAAYKAAGYDFIKIHDEQPVVLDSMMAAAKRVGIPILGHVPPPTTVEHVLGWYKSIEHPLTDHLWNSRQDKGPYDTTGVRTLAAAMARAGVWNCPTQSHYDRLHYGIQSVPGMMVPMLRRLLKDSTRDLNMYHRVQMMQHDPPHILKILQDSGVKLLLGTDEPPWIGSLTRELQAMVYAGLTPYQALLTGTRNVAEYFGTLHESGTIAVGKRADMVLLTGNPLKDVRYTAQPAGVMLGGRWLSRAEIDKHVATITFPTVTNGQLVESAPVKSYWGNVLDMTVLTAEDPFMWLAMSDTTHTSFQKASAKQQAEWKALVDSLGESDQYVQGMQRILALIAKQIGEDRAALTPAQRATFDKQAKAWVQQRIAEGGSVSIPGMQ